MEPGWFDTTITIDNVTLPIAVKRFTVSEAIAFERDFDQLRRIQNRAALSLRVWRRKLDAVDPSERPAVEWEKPPAADSPDFSTYLAQRTAQRAWDEQRDVDAIALRDTDETEAERTKRERLEADDDAFAKRLLTSTITAYVRPGDSALELDGAPVTTAAQLIEKYAGRQQILYTLVATVRVENILSDDAKKKLRSPSGSTPSSPAASLPASGDVPAMTAESASSSAPASVEAVTA